MKFAIRFSAFFLPLVAMPVRAEPPAVDFERDVRPIFASRCVTCQGPEKQKSGLRLDRKNAAMKGGDSGPAIVPGKSAASMLIQRVSSREKDERMPPVGELLSAEQIAILNAWIDQGAKWPDAGSQRDPRLEHWAFRPVKITETSPALRPARNSIDAFIHARLAKEHLSPSPEADRRALIRRLKIDLVGLPPSPAEADAFGAAADPLAYEKLVDRYLASPQYGERWARHWLDVVRFAESDGFETNQPRPNAWPYRDYVIRALNEDKPYDRFVLEQLAGDLLGADEATGFLVAGAVAPGKGADIALTLQCRAAELHAM